MALNLFLTPDDVGTEAVSQHRWLPVEFHKEVDYFIRYRWAADELHGLAVAQGNDRLVIPMLFLYRHHLELGLKMMYSLLKRYRKQVKHEAPTHHNLIKLWNAVLCDLDALKEEVGELTEDIKRLGEIVMAFHDQDPSSTAYRYARDMHGEASLKKFEFSADTLKSHMECATTAIEKICSVALFLTHKGSESLRGAKLHWGGTRIVETPHGS